MPCNHYDTCVLPTGATERRTQKPKKKSNPAKLEFIPQKASASIWDFQGHLSGNAPEQS
jgi:hypothetical protein